MMRQLRRKRGGEPDDTSSFVHSMSSDPAAAVDASSLVAQAPDSLSRPVRKRRRTILESLQSFNLDESSSSILDVPGHILGPDPDDNSQLSASEDEEDQDSVAAPQEFLSDAEKAQQAAQRTVMLELVFGRNMSPTNPVDAKIETMIRESLQKSSQCNDTTTKDDMTVETCYSRTNSGNGFEFVSHNRPRSNSLPNATTTMELEDDTMDL
jgi:hypothetical protein